MTVIDWGMAAKAASLVGGEDGPGAPLPGDVAGTCGEAELRIAGFTGLHPARPLPEPEELGRPDWTAANLAQMAAILDPLADKATGNLGFLSGAVSSIGGAAIGAEAGALTGFLSRRVLGQYDPRLLADDGPRRLLLVAPNLREAAAKLDVDVARLVRWVCVHEVTHAVQFEAVPWLRGRLEELITELLGDGKLDLDLGALMKLPSREDLKGMADAARGGELIRLVVGPERVAALDAVQAIMALVEGHAEYVMDAVGEQILGDLSDLRSALDTRRRERPPLLAWIDKLLGFELKLRQYEIGRAFCDGVVERSDVATLHRAFAAPELVPTLDELGDPAGWIARIGAIPHAA